MSWQHQASGGVGQQVGQQDMMSDESRAEWGQSSRGEKQDMTSDDYGQSRVREEAAQGTKGWKPNGLEVGQGTTAVSVGEREVGVEGGEVWQDK